MVTSMLSIFLVLFVIGGVVFSSGCVGSTSSTTWLKLVPSNAIAAGMFKMNTLQNPDVVGLMKSLNFYNAYENYTRELKGYGVNLDKMKRVIIVLEGSISALQSSNPPVGMYVEGPVNTSEFSSKIMQEVHRGNFMNLIKTTYDGVEMYYNNSPSFAIAFTSDYIVYGSKTVVQQILDLKTGKSGASWAEQYKGVVDKLGDGSLVVVGDTRYLINGLNLNPRGNYSQNATVNKLARSFLSQANYLTYGGLKVSVSNGYTVKLLLKADDPGHAKQLSKIINAAITLENTTLNPNTLTSTMAKRQMVQVKKLLSEVKVSSDSDYVIMTLTIAQKQAENLATAVRWLQGGSSNVTVQVSSSSTCVGGCS